MGDEVLTSQELLRGRQTGDVAGRAAIAFIKEAKTEEEFNRRKTIHEEFLGKTLFGGQKIDTGLRFEPPEFVQSEQVLEPQQQTKKPSLLIPGLVIGGLILLG